MEFYLIQSEHKATKINTVSKREQARLYREFCELLKAENIPFKQVNGTMGREIEIYNEHGKLIADVIKFSFGLNYTRYQDFLNIYSANPKALLEKIKAEGLN